MTNQLPHPITGPIPHLSKTAFSIPVDQEEAIVRASAYCHNDFDRAVIWFLPRIHINGPRPGTSASRDTMASLGELDKLPLELINEICLQSDILSLFRFRQTNARARYVTNALHEYQIVTAHALNAFCALLRTRSASRVTLSSFYHLLYTQRCSLCCDEDGHLVFLPLWLRYCWTCVRRGSPAIRVAQLHKVTRISPLSKTSIATLPRPRTIPGIYTMDEKRSEIRRKIVQIQAAISAIREENPGQGPGPTPQMIERLSKLNMLTCMSCCALPSLIQQTGKIEGGLSCSGCQSEMGEEEIVGRDDYGGDVRDTVFSRTEFLEHFRWCERAQSLWTASKNGTSSLGGSLI